jgi:hypothetical protein
MRSENNDFNVFGREQYGAVLRNRCTAARAATTLQVAANFYKKLHIRTKYLEKGNTYLSSSIVLFDMCNILFSYACILIGQAFICRYMPCIVSYPLFVRRHFVVCRHVSLTNRCVPRVKKVFGTLYRAVVLNLWVATQNWVTANVPMGREYFIEVTLFFYFRRTEIVFRESVWKRK